MPTPFAPQFTLQFGQNNPQQQPLLRGVTNVCNKALGLAGTRSTISAITENSPEANACAMYYDSVRQGVLRAANWNFAKQFANGALLKAAYGTPENQTVPVSSVWDPSQPPPPWSYEYAMPTDAVRIRYLTAAGTISSSGIPLTTGPNFLPNDSLPNWNRAPFEVSGDKDSSGANIKVILTNLEYAIICYTKDVTEINTWDNTAEDALVAGLAAQIANKLVSNGPLSKELLAQANQTILEARVEDGNEGLTVNDYMPDWIETRGVYPGVLGRAANNYGSLLVLL